MTLYFIGLGLNDERDISLKGLDIVKACDIVYLESYTSKLQVDVGVLEKLYGKQIIIADRNMIEQQSDEILKNAKNGDVALLIIGDIFGATTHTDMMLRARSQSVKCVYIHNASIINAIGVTGLELYKFGRTTSLPFNTESFKPQAAYDVIKQNLSLGMHTLVLLDLKPEESRYMAVNEAIGILLGIESLRKEHVFTDDLHILGCARIGGDFTIKYGKASELLNYDFGKPLYCLIVPGNLHFIEKEALDMWKVAKQ